jgi:cytosine/adenosine deaminase-related metal-dependent hydrolase
VDHRGVIASPGALLLEGDCIIQVGTPQELGSMENVSLTQIDKIVTPSFVNTHTHLDLSGAGVVAQRDSFVHWVEEVVLPIRREIDRTEDHVQKGIKLVSAGGSQIIGDIAGSQRAAELVDNSSLRSVSFVELFGLGKRQHDAIEQLNALPPHFGISPHAPYSCGRLVYEACFKSGRTVSTHLSELKEEIESVRDFQGPLVEHAKRIGSWDETVESWNAHPIEAVLDVSGGTPFVAAHLNYVDDGHLAMLAASNITVAYCPRASHYFGHTNHRWKEMLDAGINVALGTDSLLCLDTPDRISVIDEMRYLYMHDDGDPLQLLQMGTVHGAIGIGVEPSLVTLRAGETAGLLVFDSTGDHPLKDIFTSTTMPTWL